MCHSFVCEHGKLAGQPCSTPVLDPSVLRSTTKPLGNPNASRSSWSWGLPEWGTIRFLYGFLFGFCSILRWGSCMGGNLTGPEGLGGNDLNVRLDGPCTPSPI